MPRRLFVATFVLTALASGASPAVAQVSSNGFLVKHETSIGAPHARVYGPILLLGTPVHCAGPSQQADERAVGEQLMLGFAEFWNSHDLSQLDAIYADDAVFEDVPDGTTYRGLEEIKASLGEDIKYAPDVQIEVVSLFVSEDRGALEWVWSGTQTGDIPGLLPATGRAFSVRGVSLFEFSAGRIIRHADYYDAAGLLHQLGVEIRLPEMTPDG
jgi:steroid delta-isomerase-like uncharacterized protein